jgi:serine protease Do
MKFERLVAASAVVALVAVGGMLALTPEVHGQSKRRVLVTGQDGLTTFAGGGSQIGVSVRDVEASDVTGKKLSGQAGAVVEEVESDTPAAKAGVKAGDVVVGFDGERVRSARQLDRLVEETPAGRTVKLSVMRDGAKLDLDVTPDSSSTASAFALGPRFRGQFGPELKQHLDSELRENLRNHRFDMPAFDFNWDDGNLFTMRMRGRLGVQGDEVRDQLATYFGVQSGVLVSNVAADSPAAKAGLKAGDVITAVNGKPVKDMTELRREVTDSGEGKEIALSVTRDKKPLSLKATIQKPEEVRPRVRRVV